mmetsp:Transcript_10278/g.31013  ORF Transcript_10278/g.31013 Transcript_10278/m.31013 type:complete len:210 (+) Transcript_10278:319-948(+)
MSGDRTASSFYKQRLFSSEERVVDGGVVGRALHHGAEFGVDVVAAGDGRVLAGVVGGDELGVDGDEGVGVGVGEDDDRVAMPAGGLRVRGDDAVERRAPAVVRPARRQGARVDYAGVATFLRAAVDVCPVATLLRLQLKTLGDVVVVDEDEGEEPEVGVRAGADEVGRGRIVHEPQSTQIADVELVAKVRLRKPERRGAFDGVLADRDL